MIDQRPGTTGTVKRSAAANASNEIKPSNSSLKGKVSLTNGANVTYRQTMVSISNELCAGGAGSHIKKCTDLFTLPRLFLCSQSKKELNTRNLTLNLKQQCAPKLDLQEESVTLKEIKVKTAEFKSGGSRVPTSGIMNSTATLQKTFVAKEDPVSVKETKGKDNEMKATDGRASAGPSSHIPRPSSRIPMPRSR